MVHQKQSLRLNLIGSIATMYYIYIPSIDMYKLGVTTNLTLRRAKFPEHSVIAIWELDYEEAIEAEHTLMNQLHDLRYNGTKKLITEGSTELFKVDVLKSIVRALQEKSCTETHLNGETPNE